MSPAEQNYDIGDQELLAIVAALDEWHVFFNDTATTEIYTDHQNLFKFTTTKKLNSRQFKWSEILGRYRFTIKRITGRANQRADVLNRRPDYIVKEPRETKVLKINDDGSLSADFQEFIAVMNVLEDQHEQFPVAHKKLHILNERIWDCIRKYHDPPEYGHGGITNTIKTIQRSCHFNGMKNHVTNFIKQCESCQKNKHSTRRKYGNPEVIENPVTGVEYDSIWVVVDRYNNAPTCLPFQETYNAKDLHHLWMDRVVRREGHPEEIINDRDKLFTSSYWKTLTGEFRTKLKHSTAYHPQTDGQTERMNQTLEQYLRHYINKNHDNWVELLPNAELCLRKGRSLRPVLNTKSPNEEALRKANKIKGPLLKEGDKVYLLIKNLRIKRPSKKLDHVKVGLFLVDKQTLILKGQVRFSFRIKLSDDAKIRHPVFYTSFLERADSSTPLQETFHHEDDDTAEYKIERVIAHKLGNFLIK